LAQALDAQIIGRSTGQGHLHDLVLGTRLAQAPTEVPHLLDGDAPVLGQEDGLGLFELLFDLGYCLDLLRSRHALSLWIEKPPARDRGFHSEKGPTLAGLDVHLSLRAPTVSGRVLELQMEWYRRSGSPTNRDRPKSGSFPQSSWTWFGGPMKLGTVDIRGLRTRRMDSDRLHPLVSSSASHRRTDDRRPSTSETRWGAHWWTWHAPPSSHPRADRSEPPLLVSRLGFGCGIRSPVLPAHRRLRPPPVAAGRTTAAPGRSRRRPASVGAGVPGPARL